MNDVYKTILEETGAGYWDYHIREGRVSFGPAFKAMFGYGEDELPDTPEAWLQLVHDDDRQMVDKCIADHYRSHGAAPFNIEARYKTKNGDTVWINSIGRVIEWDRNEALRMVGCHYNITERKAIEHELAISETTFRDAFEHSPIGMVLVSTSGRFLKVNQSICDMLGYTHHELMDMDFQQITHPEDLDADLEMMHQTLRKERKAYQMEKRYFTRSGEVIWIMLNVSLVLNQDGEPQYFVSQIKNITERKNAENALRESERRWIFASEGSGGGIWDLDLRAQTIFHSQQCLRMIGMDNEGFGTRIGDWTSRVHPDDRDRFVADAVAYFNGDISHYENEHRVLCNDGSYKWVLDRAKVIEYDEHGKPARIIGTHIDITDQKNKQQQLRDALDLLSGQNGRLLNFAYIVSHNLRTHSSNFKMLMDEIDDPATDQVEREEMSAHLRKVSEQLNETITNLNEVVSIQTHIGLQTAELDLKTYVDKAMELLGNDIGRLGVEVVNHVPKGITITYSRAYLESILLNLISNGIKYRNPNRKPVITIEYCNEDGRHCITISDNGIGIDLKKYSGQLFGMYKTFNGNPDAKGMGLFITKNQVEALGGKIEVESQVGEGSVFKVYLG